MQTNARKRSKSRLSLALSASLIALSVFGFSVSGLADNTKDPGGAGTTASPIKHVIILLGENRGFDHTFGTYTPRKGQTISNLLSKGIVNADGTPGPNFELALQFQVTGQPSFYVGAPNADKTPYNNSNPGQMPQPNTNAAPEFASPAIVPVNWPFSLSGENAIIAEDPTSPDFTEETDTILTTGATGLPTQSLDTRVPNAGALPNGPFLLQGPNLTDDDYTGDTTHRFYQAWQQSDCSVANATAANPSGCLNDLFPFVMVTYDSNGVVQGNFSEGNSMGFLDVADGQASTLKALADRFTLSDNYHQAVQGGTGANHFMLGTGDAAFWSDGAGTATTPPGNRIANPDPVAGTTNKYTADNNFSNCSDVTQHGVGPIVSYLADLPYHPSSNCVAGHYYMLNNTNPGFYPNGFLPANPGALNMVPPLTVRTIGDALNEKNITWAYFGGSYDEAVNLSNVVQTNAVLAGLNSTTALQDAVAFDPADILGTTYCLICNPFQYASSIMNNPAQVAAHLKDTRDLLSDIENNLLPSVSIGKPDGQLDGHPSSSKIDLFEAYVRQVLAALEANPALKANTAVFITVDEAGGYWDSGYIQPIDFFGDGPRIPLLVLSPYSTGGNVNHGYADHVSLLKFIERNWGLNPLTERSRDNLPNPTTHAKNPYVPTNSPALSDLFDAFDFSHAVNQTFFP